MTKKNVFTLTPTAMTKVWLAARTDDEIRQLLKHWKDSIYSTTQLVRREANRRNIPW